MPRRLLDASGKYVFPGGIDVHTHLDMPFGGTTSADDFETGTRAAAFGGTTTLIDFAIQYKGQPLRKAFDTWMDKASRKAVCDYAFHCIVTDISDGQLQEMNALVGEGVTSFKLFMAYPGVFMLDDASIFRALQTTAKNGGLICMHAENGSAIDVIVQQALAEGKKAPKYHALTRPTTAEAEAVSRAIALAEMAGAPIYIVHLSCNEALEKVREARDRGLPVYAETCPQYLYLSIENFDVPGFRRREICFHSAASRKMASGKTLERPEARSSAGRLHRSLSILFQRAERTRTRRLHEDTERWPGHRASHEPDLLRRRCSGTFQRESIRRTRFHDSGKTLWPVSAEGNDRGRQRRRSRDFRSRSANTPSAPRLTTCEWITRCSKASR